MKIKTNLSNLIQFTLLDTQIFIRRPPIEYNNYVINPKILGLSILLKGRLKGVKRARKLQFMSGKIKAQTTIFPVQAKSKSIQTK